MRIMTGRIIAILALLLLFFAYSNFAPIALSSDHQFGTANDGGD